MRLLKHPVRNMDENPKRNILILGASQGIGYGFVKHLLDDKATTIFATYRNPESAMELLELANLHPLKITCFQMDVTDENQIEEVVKQIKGQISKLHLVINCIGFLHEGKQQPEKSLRQLNSENLLRYFQVNSISAVLLAKNLLPLLKHRDRSVFVSISAKLGSIGDNQLGGWYGYRASKAALNMFIRTAAIEYSRSSPNTIISVLHPGTTDTRLSKPFQNNVPSEKLFSIQRTVNQLLTVIENLKEEDSGQFFSWDGSPLPW
jgi:NAD(P)-dependent dehydrogenase (short-subunit alcohol dehydrogenase family)